MLLRYRLAAAALVLAAAPALAQPTAPLGQLPAPGLSSDSQFGYAVAASGDRLVVGAPGEGAGPVGAAFVYFHDLATDTWVLEEELVPSSIEAAGEFLPALGTSAAMSGEFALVGAPYESGEAVNSGAAYLFWRQEEPEEWVDFVKLKAPEPQVEAEFGFAVGLSGGVAVVGAPGEDAFGEGTGAVYVYEQDLESGAWDFRQSLAPVEAPENLGFGYAVAAAGNTFAAGTLNRFGPTDPAFVYVFAREGPLQPFLPAQALSGDGEVGDRFGTALALSDSVLAVGAPFDGEADAGAVYVFERDEASDWHRVAKLTPTDLVDANHFGASVALDGNTLLVGAPLADAENEDAGAAYVFTREAPGSWTQAARLTVDGGVQADQFGFAVAVAGDFGLVGAPAFGKPGDAGAVYVFGPAGTGAEGEATASAFALAAPFPSPFRTATTVAFTLDAPADVALTAHNVLGREVAVLAAGTHPAGRHTVRWEAGGLPSGLYVLRLAGADASGRRATAVRKVLLVR